MATSPSDVRTGLTLVTSAAVEDAQTVAASGNSAEEVRTALFVAAPLIVHDYNDGAAALALDWYEELRAEAAPAKPFAPSPIHLVTDEDVRTAVAVSTVALRGAPDEALPDAVETSMTLLGGELRKLVASGFWNTMTTNSVEDPSAVGWRRYARPDACKFCLMAADKGAVYTRETARFAPHNDCHCLAGPGFDPHAPLASAMQYVASQRRRTAKQRAELRAYLNQHFPDAPG